MGVRIGRSAAPATKDRRGSGYSDGMSGPLTFLVASPHLQGSLFESAVVLLLEHDAQGALGLMVHLPSEQTVADLMPDLSGETVPAWWGGPVDPSLGWCLYQFPVGLEGEVQLTPGLMVSSSLDVLRAVVGGGQRYMLLLGYAGWAAGQLTAEARQGTWLWVEQDSADLIWNVPADERWSEALSRLGVNPDTIVAGGAQA